MGQIRYIIAQGLGIICSTTHGKGSQVLIDVSNKISSATIINLAS